MLPLRKEIIFAWLPVRTEDGKLAWLTWLEREKDENPIQYLELNEEVTHQRPIHLFTHSQTLLSPQKNNSNDKFK